MNDLERVAAAIAATDDKWKRARWEDVPERIKQLFRADATAAMRATRLIDAEALRDKHDGLLVSRMAIADWFQSRAGGDNE